RLDEHRECVGYFVGNQCGWRLGFYMRIVTEMRETVHRAKQLGINCPELNIKTSMVYNPLEKHPKKVGNNRPWSIFCIARYEGQITWYRKRRKSDSLINFSERVKRCMKSGRCRYSIKQTSWPVKEKRYVSELHIKSLKLMDFTTYTCRMSNLSSKPFKLVRQRGRTVCLTPFY
ncbi:hypothetical protein ElyMa_000653300, partial [Elysia marginata]